MSIDINSFNWWELCTYSDSNYQPNSWRTPLSTFKLNVITYFLIACNRFKWDSETVKPLDRCGKLIEYYLATRGQCFIDKRTLSVLQGYPTGKLDMYGNPENFYVMGYNGESDGKHIVKYDDVIWIKNNSQRIPSIYWILKYCRRIDEIEKTMDLNIQVQKTPFIAECDPLTEFSVKEMFREIDSLEKCVVTDSAKGLTDNIKILPVNAPYLVNQLYDQKINETNDLLNFFGIDTVQEKNAHMIYAEVQNSNETTDNYTDIFVSERKIAIKQAERAGIDLHLSMLDTSPDMTDLNGGEELTDVEANNNDITQIA